MILEVGGDSVTVILHDCNLKCCVVLQGYSGCPNKYNVYHECTAFCEEKWGQGFIEPDPSYMRKKQRMLLNYPLPENWVEVYDPGT